MIEHRILERSHKVYTEGSIILQMIPTVINSSDEPQNLSTL